MKIFVGKKVVNTANMMKLAKLYYDFFTLYKTHISSDCAVFVKFCRFSLSLYRSELYCQIYSDEAPV